MEHLAFRYQTRYSIDIYKNLKEIKEKGLDAFVKEEATRWTCAKCGGVVCMHKGCCSACGDAVMK